MTNCWPVVKSTKSNITACGSAFMRLCFGCMHHWPIGLPAVCITARNLGWIDHIAQGVKVLINLSFLKGQNALACRFLSSVSMPRVDSAKAACRRGWKVGVQLCHMLLWFVQLFCGGPLYQRPLAIHADGRWQGTKISLWFGVVPLVVCVASNHFCCFA